MPPAGIAIYACDVAHLRVRRCPFTRAAIAIPARGVLRPRTGHFYYPTTDFIPSCFGTLFPSSYTPEKIRLSDGKFLPVAQQLP